jgi:hypothetical protein
LGAQEIECRLVLVELPEAAAVTVNNWPLLTPLRVADTTIQPVTNDCAVAVKTAVLSPCSTLTLAGTVMAGLLLARVTTMSPVGFDRVAVQAVPVPTASFVLTHVTDNNDGVDHSVNVAPCDDAPTVAVTVPVVSAGMLPMLALKAFVALPVVTTMLAGTVIRAEVELSVTVVSVGAGCERVAVHELVTPDITPFGAQTTEVTSTGATSVIVTDCNDPL